MAYTPVPAVGQTNMAGSLPVTIASDQSAVPVSGTVTATSATFATAAKQDTGNTSVASIDTKTPALGQALAASSTPVVLTAAQITTLTPPAAITGFATETTLGSVKTSVELIDNAISGAGFNITQFGGAAVPIGAGTEAAAVRVTLPTDGTGLVIAKQATAANLNMTEASAASILTSVQLIDDTVFVDDTATHSTGSTKGIGIMAAATPTDTAVNANDIGMVGMTNNREMYVSLRDISGAAAVTGSGTATGALRVELANNSTGTVVATQGTATNLKTQAEAYQGGSAVASGNPLQVTVANTGANSTAIKVNVASGGIASGAIASGAIASGAVASGAFASGSIAAGAIAVGATSIADNEDVASAGADTLVKVAQIRQDTPVANASVSNDGDYTHFRADNFGKTWITGTINEDVAHIAAEPISALGARRIDPCATSSGTDGDWSTVNQSAEGALYVTAAPTTASGLSVAMFTSADGSTALTNSSQVIKASAGNLYGYYIYNPNAAATYVHLYNTASASVTVGTTNPLITLCIPATSGANMNFTYPVTFSNAGWAISATTTGGGNTAPTTALEAVIFYK